jgi:hypothetical protein
VEYRYGVGCRVQVRHCLVNAGCQHGLEKHRDAAGYPRLPSAPTLPTSFMGRRAVPRGATRACRRAPSGRCGGKSRHCWALSIVVGWSSVVHRLAPTSPPLGICCHMPRPGFNAICLLCNLGI